jgi:hypothetical protein
MATALEMTWGETFTFTHTVTSGSGAVNLNGKTLRFMAKTTYGAADAGATISKASSSGIVHTTPASGIATITISPADTAALNPAETTVLVWDIRVIDGANAYTTDSGTLSVGPAVVRAVA